MIELLPPKSSNAIHYWRLSLVLGLNYEYITSIEDEGGRNTDFRVSPKLLANKLDSITPSC